MFTARATVSGGRAVEDGRYEFPMEISSNRLDSYYTRMAEDSLRNFKRDASGEGVGVLEAHQSRTLPIGRTFRSKMETVDDPEMGERTRVVSDAFMLKGMQLANLTYASTDDVIFAIDNGILRDVSVGFYDAFFRCDICKIDMFDWFREDYCRHWPGETYEIDGESVLCTATVEGARLAEVSIVYSGATPEAGILRKARNMVASGELDSRKFEELNVRYNLRTTFEEMGLSKERSIFDMSVEKILSDSKIASLPAGPEEAVQWLVDRYRDMSRDVERLESQVSDAEAAIVERDTLKDKVGTLESERDELVEAAALTRDVVDGSKRLREENEKLTDKVDKLEESRELAKSVEQERDAFRQQIDALDAEISELNTKIEGLTMLAELGESARTELIDATLEAGIRADKVTAETRDEMREMLEGMTLDTIRERRDFWTEVADVRLGGGRKTVEQQQGADDTEEPSHISRVAHLNAYGIRA